LVPADRRLAGTMRAKQAGVVCGLPLFQIVCDAVVEGCGTGRVRVDEALADGAQVAPGDVVLRCQGDARTLLIAEHPEVGIERDYDPSLPDLAGDEAQLIQAVLNVARNAEEAMQGAGTPEPRLVLRTRARRQFTLGAERHRLVCEVGILDNGPGVPEALKETLFYPMVSGRPDGSGLGLSIAQGILHRHQGLIECDSVPGHTEFRLLIPLETRHD
ncbi:MAG: ATP-binding protein, partial [Halomonas sp.]